MADRANGCFCRGNHIHRPLIDDLIATGGTIAAGVRLVEQLGGKIVKVLCLMELKGLEGRKKLENYDVSSIIAYEGK